MPLTLCQRRPSQDRKLMNYVQIGFLPISFCYSYLFVKMCTTSNQNKVLFAPKISCLFYLLWILLKLFS